MTKEKAVSTKREWRQTTGGSYPGTLGSVPETCDGCGHPFFKVAYDAKTKYGPWGWLCTACFEEVGLGLGVGRGQRYQLVETGNETGNEGGEENGKHPR